jgi:hypothetical protein
MPTASHTCVVDADGVASILAPRSHVKVVVSETCFGGLQDPHPGCVICHNEVNVTSPRHSTQCRVSPFEGLSRAGGNVDDRPEKPNLIRYANEKLWAGIRVLVCHPGDISKRMIAAWQESFTHVPPAGLPGSIRREFEEMRAKMYDDVRESFVVPIEKLATRELVAYAEALYRMAYATDTLK